MTMFGRGASAACAGLASARSVAARRAIAVHKKVRRGAWQRHPHVDTELRMGKAGNIIRNFPRRALQQRTEYHEPREGGQILAASRLANCMTVQEEYHIPSSTRCLHHPPAAPPPVTRRRDHRAWLEKVLRAALVGWYVCLSLGIEIPSVAAAQLGVDASQPFPCQQHGCGCSTAAQCWNACCCFSPRERLAWAREHGVETPELLKRQAERSPGDRQAAAACCHTESPAAGACCHRGAERAGRAGDDNARCAEAAAGGVQLLRALRCQGIEPSWLLAAPVCMPLPGIGCQSLLPVGTLVLFMRDNHDSPAFAPPVPPPRAACFA